LGETNFVRKIRTGLGGVKKEKKKAKGKLVQHHTTSDQWSQTTGIIEKKNHDTKE